MIKTTLEEIGDMLAHVVKHMLTKEDGEKFATKDSDICLHTQVNSIEPEIRNMKHVRFQSGVAHLEEGVLGGIRPTTQPNCRPPPRNKPLAPNQRVARCR